MNMYGRIWALVVCSAMLAIADSPADVFEQAPPHVDKALRERVDKFMQAHIQGKFRLAEEVVHDDSKDIFYNAQKSQYISYRVVKISWSERFTKAVVVTQVEMDWVTSRLGKRRVKPPLTTNWKLDKGQWWWYALPEKEWRTPWGNMTPGPDSKLPKEAVMDVANLHSKVTVDRTEIRLKGTEPSEDSVVLRSEVLGGLRLSYERELLPPGLSIKFSKDVVEGGETSTITFTYNPPDKSLKPSREVQVTVSPIVKIIPFRLTFALSPEQETTLPKGFKLP